jgi:hypothetical protein
MVRAETMAGIHEPDPFGHFTIPRSAKGPGCNLQFTVATLLLAAALVTTRQSAATEYIFATFTGDAAANEKLSIYTSPDGLNFKLLSNTGFAGPTGVLRDPTIMRHSDGNYYVAYTTASWTTTSTSFAIASSSDLINWTYLTTISAGVAGVHDTWAPEWFKDSDGSINLIVNIDTLGTDSDFQSYVFTATDGTLTTWSGPTPIGIGPNYIDTFVVKNDGAYHAFAKNETTKYIEHATATSLTGPWTWTDTGNWAGWGSGKEGPALVQLDDGQWRLFMDCYTSCGYLYATGTNLTSWTATALVPGGLSGVVRHGTVLKDDSFAGTASDAGIDAGENGGTSTGLVGGAAGFTTVSNGGTTSASDTKPTESGNNCGCRVQKQSAPITMFCHLGLCALILACQKSRRDLRISARSLRQSRYSSDHHSRFSR